MTDTTNVYLEKIAKKLSRGKAKSVFDETKEMYDDGKDLLEIKKRLATKNKKLKATTDVVTPANKKRVSISGRKMNRGVIVKRKAK